MSKIAAAGNTQERELYAEVMGHYDMAKEDLEARIPQMDKNDELFRSHINKKNWPYRAKVFDPRIFTAIVEKTSRQFANKPQGRMVPREGGDSLGAKICNELLMWQWDDNVRVDDMPMIIKWALMGMNSRRYGVSYGLAKWHWKRQIIRNKDKEKPNGKSRVFFDGPNFRTLNNRDCLPNPSYTTIKNWFQHRDYVTWQDLLDTNDAARGKPVYKNLDILRDQMKKESKKGGDTRESNWASKNLAIAGLQDYLGRDEVFRTIEVVTEYRNDRWITFASKYGVILRDVPNPYDHGQIPVVQLKYIPIDEDQAGISEIEPVERLQKATNALICQYLDAINMSLYAPLKVRKTGGAVQMHTLEFGAGAKWMMDNPSEDVVTHDQNITGVTEFASTYRFLIGAMQEALGETSEGASNLSPGQQDKTATEIRDLAGQRNSRDNFNQIFLHEAIKKQMGFWHKMNQQFLFSSPNEQQKVIRIVGKDAIAYFQRMGLDQEGMDEETTMRVADLIEKDPDLAGIIKTQDLAQPQYPVDLEGDIVPKFNLEEDQQNGSLIIEPDDLAGNYDYIPDVQSMQIPDDAQMIAAGRQLIELTTKPEMVQLLLQDGYRIKTKEMFEDYFERLGYKDADKYFERIQEGGGLLGQEQTGQQAVAAGAGGVQGGVAGAVPNQQQGIPAGVQAVPTGQA